MIHGPEDSHLADPRPESSFPTRGRMAAASRLICARSFWGSSSRFGDIVSLGGGRDWWSQIEEALKVEGAGAFCAPGYAGGARDRRIAIRRRVGKILT